MQIVKTSPLPSSLNTLVEDTIGFVKGSRAENTINRYHSYWKAFTAFCAEHGLDAMPADLRTVAVYLTSLAKGGKAMSTVQGHLAALKFAHERRGEALDTEAPIISEVMAGIRRTLGTAQHGSDAVLPEDLRALVAACETGKVGLRDRALLLVGFAGGFRRSELTALTVADIEWVDQGMVLLLRRSKTDQEGRGMEKAIPFASDEGLCPVRSLKAWLSAAGITEGPLFRRVRKNGLVGAEALAEHSVYRIVVALVEAAGLSGKITPHSLRAGFATAALLNGAQVTRVAKHLGHRSIQTTMKYDRVADRFRDHAGEGLL